MIKKAVVVHYLNSNSASDLEDLESKILENNVTRFNYPWCLGVIAFLWTY